ncbi:MAG: D-aminoacyl-tRNA deacylase [Halanaeroarchaeum sp.]
MIGIVVSRADEASEHIGEHLLDLADWRKVEDADRAEGDSGGAYYRHGAFELRTFDDLHLHLEGVAGAFDDPDLVVFASRHAGETGALLTAHFTGNVGPAEYGGRDGELARAAPNAHDSVLDALCEYAPDGYDVGMECTHHGPSSVGAPSMFVEVGSAEEQWRDPDAARAVAHSVLDLDGGDPDRKRTVVGFGGGHYAPRFGRIARETDWAVGHVAADWGLDAMADFEEGTRRDVLEQAFEKSGAGASHAVLDGDRPEIETAIDDLGYRVVSETWVRETSGVPLDLVERAEHEISTVEAGLRFGDRLEVGDFEVCEPDPDLLGDANGIDAERTREAIRAHAVAYDTEENGTRVAGRIAIPPGEYDDLIDALVDILEARYGDELVAVERAFVPERALELGVPEGPKFGRLAGGEPVEMDGETIPPDAVHEERTRRYRV